MRAGSTRRAAIWMAPWLAFLAAPVMAHEFWIEPTQSAPAAGAHIGVYLCNGDGYDGWSLPRDPQRLESFTAYDVAGARPVVGLDGSDPAGFVRFERAGPQVLAYVSRRAPSVMPPDKFDRYLEDKGLRDVLAVRASQPRRNAPVRESFSRYAKLLLNVSGPGAASDRRIGLPFEIVAEGGLGAGRDGPVAFQLLFGGKPLAGALVKATRLGTTDAEVEARTGPDGRVSFRFDEAGFWRVAAVQMVRPSAGADADWDSLWASLTFDLPRADGSRAAPLITGAPHCQNRVLDANLQVSR